jgi:hypothetical protein
MDIISAYREVGSYRGAAAISGTTPKTVKRVIARHESGAAVPAREPREHNYDAVAALVAERVEKTKGKITAKRLLPAVRAAGYEGSARNFRRLVAERKALWRQDNHRGRRPAVWSPGEHLVIDWGVLGGLHVFCAVLAWCRVRFVRFADNERRPSPKSVETSDWWILLLGAVLRAWFRRWFEGAARSGGQRWP